MESREQAADLLTTRSGLKAEINHFKKVIRDEQKARRRFAGMGAKRKQLAKYDDSIREQKQTVKMLQDRFDAMPVPARKPIPTERALVRLDPVMQAQEGLAKKPRTVKPRITAEAARGKPVELSDDWKVAAKVNDPSPTNPPNKGGPPGGQGGIVDDAADNANEALERLRRQRIEDEAPEGTLTRRHDGAISDAQNEVRILVDQGNELLRKAGVVVARQGRWVPRKQDIAKLDELFEALHNPSKVARGELRVPAGLGEAYEDLRRLTDWEEAMRLKVDPGMAIEEDYFYRGWLVPKEMTEGVAGVPGPLGRKPSFQKPRVDATYREMRDAGFEPISWNPYEQLRISKLQRIRHEQQMQLISDLKVMELAKPQADVVGVPGWRTPKVGPAFEGNQFKGANSIGEEVVGYSSRWAVPDKVANLLENMYGTMPSDAVYYVGSRRINIMKLVDRVVFIPKRAKLFGSFFQQIDFIYRFYSGSWGAFSDALSRGKPITSIMHLAKIPKSIFDIGNANFNPGARARIRVQLNSTDPIVPGRPGIHFKGITQAGLSTIDTTIMPRDLDQVARVVADELGLLGNKAVMRAVRSLESAMRRGLYEGTYPAAHIAAIKNYVAPMMVRMYGKNLSDEALNGLIAHAANRHFSTLPAVQSILGNQRPFVRETLRRIFFSIGESEGLIRQATGTFRGPARRYWLTHWAGVYLGLAVLANSIHWAVTGEPLPFRRYSPISKDKWGLLPVGYNPEFMAPDTPIRDPITGNRVMVDLVNQMDTVFRLLDPMSFLSARESVPIRAAITQLGGRDYFGRRIDQVGPNGIYSKLANLINDLFNPIGPGQSAVQIALQKGVLPEGLLPESERQLGVSGQVVQASGINLRGVERWGWDARDAVDKYTMEIDGEETTLDGLKEHPLVRESIKLAVPQLGGKVDKYLDARFSDRREVEKSSDFRAIRDALSDEYDNEYGKLYELRDKFLNKAPNGWIYTAAATGVSFPNSKKMRDAINIWMEKGNEFPDVDLKTWSGDFDKMYEDIRITMQRY